MAAVFPQKHLTNLAEWHKMGEAGIFPPDARLELINGEIFHMAPIGFNHSGHINGLTALFSRLVPKRAIISVQNPLQLNDLSEPEPDFMLLKPETHYYSKRHPQTSDVLLLIEVADTSLNYDRNDKMKLYALHGIEEYWVINLTDNCLEVFRQPENNQYTQHQILDKCQKITLVNFPDITLFVSDILF